MQHDLPKKYFSTVELTEPKEDDPQTQKTDFSISTSLVGNRSDFREIDICKENDLQFEASPLEFEEDF